MVRLNSTYVEIYEGRAVNNCIYLNQQYLCNQNPAQSSGYYYV